MTQANIPLIRIEEVQYTHWNQQEPTLRGVSLEIQPGTLNVLVGPGGSGKSTLCSLFNGEIPHLLGGELRGKVYLDGKDTAELIVSELAKAVGHVYQDPETMFATLYVEDEIAFGPENLREDTARIRQTVAELLRDTDLLEKRENLVWNLSGGQIQKLGLASVLAMHPRLIVLDEPAANLDPAATFSVHQLILKLREAGMSIFLVTRELDDFLLGNADQLLVLDQGQMHASGKVQEVLLAHGAYLTEKLGVWLPESVEIGIALRHVTNGSLQTLPFRADETLAMLRAHGYLHEKLSGPAAVVQLSHTETLVQARGVVYAYENDFQALKGVDLDIHRGEMLAIVGRNGAGKSTLAKLLTGLLKPTRGELTLFGKDARSWKVQELAQHIALVFQNPEHQFLTDSVHDEIEYSLLARDYNDEEEREQIIASTLDQLDLVEGKDAHPFSLSAGKKRRLGVATMLVGHPEILLLDEPTYGQDRQMTETLMQLMEEIRAQGVTV
ncbi:MAG: ABC transporter ATP-binding protein, partial [Anaerolineaceae bacterium]|nr:ABC transporter ATP-binding protein [Anaerolineaceae bacterium]